MASAKRLLQEAYRMWFIGLTFNVIAGMYSLWQIRQKEQNIDKNEGEGVVESKKLVKYGRQAPGGQSTVLTVLQGTYDHQPSAHI